MLPEMEKLIEKTAELKEAESLLVQHVEELLFKRLEFVQKMGVIAVEAKEKLDPMSDEVDQIESEISQIMNKSGINNVKIMGMGVKNDLKFKATVKDIKLALEFAIKHPDCIKIDILKTKETQALFKGGYVPNVKRDGISCNEAYRKITYTKG
jgi:flagellin-like hook-associated protein FlgL